MAKVLKIATYNVHMWYSGDGRFNLEDIVALYREVQPDILCLQEVTSFNLTKFIKDTGLQNCLKFGGCAVLSNMKSEMSPIPSLAKFGKVRRMGRVQLLEEYQKESKDPVRVRHVSCRVQPEVGQHFYLVCLHLDHAVEPTRMREMNRLESKMKQIFESKEPQVWLGDYNSLKETDYSEENWKEVARIRKQNSWEPPKTQVTSKMADMGFEDTWDLMGKPKPISTCRFDTHIDYIYTNEQFREHYKPTAIIHHPSKASDHSLVMATFKILPHSYSEDNTSQD